MAVKIDKNSGLLTRRLFCQNQTLILNEIIECPLLMTEIVFKYKFLRFWGLRL